MTDYVFDGEAFNTGAYNAGTNPGGLAEGGHRVNLLRMLESVLADVASGMIVTSTTSRTIGTGAFTFTMQTTRAIPVGATCWVIYNNTNKMFGEVTAIDTDAGTITITVAADGTTGAGTYASWVIMPTGPQGAAGTPYWQTPIVVAVGDSPVAATDRGVYLCRTSTGAIEIDGPADGRVRIVDIDGDASTNNITFDPAGADTVTFGTIDTDYFSGIYQRRPSGTNWDLM